MATTLFSSLTEEDKDLAIQRLIDESTPRDDFFLLTVLSVLMGTFGLLMDNAAVIIGSMLIAPLLSPILSLSLGIVMADFRLITRSFYTVAKAIAWAVPAAAIMTLFFSSQAGLDVGLNAEILSRTEPSILYIMVAVIAGMAASFAMIKPQLNASLPGVAISVAIIPPLAVTGIGLARLDWAVMTDSFILFFINAIAIVFASMIIFSLMNLYVKRPVAEKAIDKEDAALEQEKVKAEEEALKEKVKNEKLQQLDREVNGKR